MGLSQEWSEDEVFLRTQKPAQRARDLWAVSDFSCFITQRLDSPST